MPHPALSAHSVAVVTGGASGLGLAAAMRFARLGIERLDAGDIVENRPALSRWHPDYAEAFTAFVNRA